MKGETEQIEIDLLLEAVFRKYGYDFRSYARASIERRLRRFAAGTDCKVVSELIPRVLHDQGLFERLARFISIPVTEMFRDPFAYRAVREQLIPMLKTWPHFKIWHAGCATGEEVYSLAIVLMEEGVYERTTIYATDFNPEVLERAQDGIYELSGMREATANYQLAGGKESFSKYYHARYDAAVMDATLRDRVVFSAHNLASDSAFGEMHLVFCRNVLIYFNRELKNRALELFTESLVHGGFLCLGSKEDLQFTSVHEHFQVLDRRARIYRKSDLGPRSSRSRDGEQGAEP